MLNRVFKSAGNTGVKRAACGPHDKHQRQDHRRLPIGIQHGQDGAGDCADGELTFCADIPVIRPITDGKPDRDQDQRRGLDREFMQGPDFQQRLDEEAVECADGLFAKRCKDDGANDKRQHQSQERRENSEELGDPCAFFKFNAHERPAPYALRVLCLLRARHPSTGQFSHASFLLPDRRWRAARRK